MPEGDSIFRTARALHQALAGSSVTRFESMIPALNRINEDHPIAGRQVRGVTARGKHILMDFSGDLVLHTHMRMNGSWHLYKPGERWHRPRRDMRVVVETETRVAVGFNIPVAEFLTERDRARHRALRALGPDLLDSGFDPVEVHRRMALRSGDTVANVLLDQRVMAGIGNVFRSEILFLARVQPFTAVGELSERERQRVIDQARTLLAANVLPRSQTLGPAVGRRTTRSMDPTANLWVYGRGGRPCRECSTPIRVRKVGVDARPIYWCPACQPGPTT
jgi:endonuclease VIII